MPNEKPISYTNEQIKQAAEYCKNSPNCGKCPINGTWNCRLIFTPRLLTLESEAADLHNELCQRCGKYKQAHKGACDGCRWKK